MKKIVLLAFVLVLLPTVLSLFVVGFLELQIAYASPYTSIDVDTAYDMITNGSYPDLVVLDVRTQTEYDSGHIYGAVWIPVTELEARIGELAGHENHEIIVYCLSGGRSVTASGILDSHNFIKVYNMLGGITAWESAGYPVWIATVHNVNTTFNYDIIQAAIDAPQTLDGHTILADTGIYYEHVVVNKSISLIGENRSNTIIDGNGTGNVIEVTASNVNITGFTIQNGIYPWNGIILYYSNNNKLIDNNVLNSYIGIELEYSSNNILVNNTVSRNTHGINLDASSDNILSNNAMVENSHNFGVWGLSGPDFNNTVYLNNTADDKPIYYMKGVSNVVYDLSTNAATIYVINSVNVTVKDLKLSNNREGIHFWNTSNSKIENVVTSENEFGIWLERSSYNVLVRNIASNNNIGIHFCYQSNSNRLVNNSIASNVWGIHFYESNSNTLVSNIVSNNKNGIELDYSTNNIVYHNNFIDNLKQVVSVDSINIWDDGYPSGGNYWSNYTGVDVYSGPNQDEAGSDGISDTTYIIYGTNQDRYPLMSPISFFNAGIWNEITYYVDTVSNSTVSDFYFSKDDKLVSFNVTGPSSSVGFCRVTIPKELLWCNNLEQWQVWVNNTLIEDGNVMEDTNHTYIYFTYNHTTQAVTIAGTAVIPIPPNADAGPEQSVFKGMTVAFDGGNSTDNAGIASYTWSFVDVTPKTLTGIQPNYTFNNIGDYEVTLNISDYAGNWDTDTMWVHVLPDTTKPSIGDVSQVPTIPDDGEEVKITVDVTDMESGVRNVTLSYSTDGGETWNNITMQKTTGDTYQGEIHGQPAGTHVQYKIIAYDNACNPAVEDNAGSYYIYTVTPEFPAWTSMLLVLIVLTVVINIYKRRLLKTASTSR